MLYTCSPISMTMLKLSTYVWSRHDVVCPVVYESYTYTISGVAGNRVIVLSGFSISGNYKCRSGFIFKNSKIVFYSF
jgi:hypothetical protein